MIMFPVVFPVMFPMFRESTFVLGFGPLQWASPKVADTYENLFGHRSVQLKLIDWRPAQG